MALGSSVISRSCTSGSKFYSSSTSIGVSCITGAGGGIKTAVSLSGHDSIWISMAIGHLCLAIWCFGLKGQGKYWIFSRLKKCSRKVWLWQRGIWYSRLDNSEKIWVSSYSQSRTFTECLLLHIWIWRRKSSELKCLCAGLNGQTLSSYKSISASIRSVILIFFGGLKVRRNL